MGTDFFEGEAEAGREGGSRKGREGRKGSFFGESFWEEVFGRMFRKIVSKIC